MRRRRIASHCGGGASFAIHDRRRQAHMGNRSIAQFHPPIRTHTHTASAHTHTTRPFATPHQPAPTATAIHIPNCLSRPLRIPPLPLRGSPRASACCLLLCPACTALHRSVTTRRRPTPPPPRPSHPRTPPTRRDTRPGSAILPFESAGDWPVPLVRFASLGPSPSALRDSSDSAPQAAAAVRPFAHWKSRTAPTLTYE